MTPTDQSLWHGYTNSSGSVPSWALAMIIQSEPQNTLDVRAFTQWGPWGLCTSMLLVAVVAVLRGYWVPGSYYQTMKAERDTARQDATDAIKTLERLTAGWKPQQ